MVDAYKKGELTKPSAEVKKVAGGISKQSAHDFAKTKRKGLPAHKKEKHSHGGHMKYHSDS